MTTLQTACFLTSAGISIRVYQPCGGIILTDMGEATNRVRSTKSASTDPYNVPFDDTGILKVDETPGWEVLKQKAQPVTEFDAEFKETAQQTISHL